MSAKTRSKSPAVLTAPVCAMLLAFMAEGALAQSSATVSVPIRATVGGLSVTVAASQPAPEVSSEIGGCTFSSTGINFGAVTGSSLKSKPLAARYSVQGSLTIACPSSVQIGTFGIQIGLDSGANAAEVAGLHLPKGSTATRALSHGSSSIAYDLYKPAVSAGLFLTGLAPAPTPTASTVRYEWGNIAQASDAGSCDVPGSSSLGSLFCLVDEGGDGLAFTLSSPILLTVPFSGSGDITIPIVATIPGGQFQSLPPGLYTDTITLTLLFF